MPPKKKKKIIKLGKKNKPVTLKRITSARKKLKRLSPFETIMAKFRELVPVMKDAKGDLLESWTLFAHKLLLARRLKTSVNVITVNPQMLEYRELLQKAFPCTIQDPTEARFGMDSIQHY
jgi:hypothetical protein